MKTALFIMLPVPSHYNACFGLADNLRKKGYRVVFTGTLDLQIHIETQGFEFFYLSVLEEYVIRNWQVALGLFIKNIIDKGFMRKRFRDFLSSAFAVQKLCLSILPDELFIDQHLNYYYFLLRDEYKYITLVNTKLPTRKTEYIPPLTCSIPFKKNKIYYFLSKILWFEYLYRRKLHVFLKKIIFLNIDEQFFIERFATKMGIDINKYRCQDNALFESIKNIPIIHVRPQFLEYSWYKIKEFEQFIYYPYERINLNPIESTEVWPIVYRFLKAKNICKHYLIYASLGTLSGLQRKDAIVFFTKIIKVVEKLPNIYLVISAGELLPYIYELNSNNVNIFNRVQQPNLLPYCDLMITHGGMNSICDCLTANVPMLVYPLNYNSDQPGNAARIVTKGLGMKGNLRLDTEAKIKKNILKMLINSNFSQSIKDLNMNVINY